MSTEELKVIVYPNALDAMGLNRLVWPAQVLHRRGYHVQMMDPDDPHRIRWARSLTGEVVDVVRPPADVVVVQRITQPRYVEILQKWQDKGVQVVVDMDDDFTSVSRLHNPSFYRLLHGSDTSAEAATEACKIADRVVVASSRLQDIYGGTVVRNAVPQQYLQINVDKYRVLDMFGWTGQIQFRLTDPTVVGDAFRRLTRRGWRFGIVGDGGPLARQLFNVSELPMATGNLDTFTYPYMLARLGCLAIPLSTQEFNQAKSWLTMLVAASLGVVPVVSPHPEYQLLADMGVGLIARDPGEWYDQIDRILRDDHLRTDLEKRGRSVAARYTLERRAQDWWTAWTGVAPEPSLWDTDPVPNTPT